MSEVTLEQAIQIALQHHQAGQLAEAETIYQQILAVEPQQPEALHYLGILAGQVGNDLVAIKFIQQALVIRPNWPEALSNLGALYSAQGRLVEALDCYQQAIALKPDYAEAHNNLGNVYYDQGLLNDALIAFRQAIALKPDLAEAHNNLGNTLKDQGLLEEASVAYRQALALKPDLAEIHGNLGNVLKDQGLLDEASVAYRQAIELAPLQPVFHTDYLLMQHYHPGYDAETIAQEHRLWNTRHAEPLRQLIKPHQNDPTTDRRLRIGYISPDFREHAVARLLIPLLQHHQHRDFAVMAYAQVSFADTYTQRFQSYTDSWRNIVGLSDQQVADLIRQDQIDILVDLAGHTANQRLLVLAQKPAPIQVTAFGYPDTTGLKTIDYRLTDAWADPVGLTEHLHSEQLVRLPVCGWCIDLPTDPVPQVRRPGPITLGCFNTLAKVTEPMLELWGQIMQQIPDSRLFLKAKGLSSHSIRQRIQGILSKQGIAVDRLELRGQEQGYAAHLERYRELDIALDPFPYHGTVSSCEALWMGVPVITLAGRTHVSRVGVSLLNSVGLQELIAQSPEQYLEIAVRLAHDLPRLQTLHATLRERMQASSLMDGRRFSQHVEAAYRQMWFDWCAQQ